MFNDLGIMNKKLYKSNNRTICGVCGGIAEYFDIDPVLVRVGYLALSFFCSGFPGLLMYFIMASLMPKVPSEYV